ncbi:GNAT family N-acetyltransferase [Streptomyces sp. NPDC057910]|uniref:GNAT family N-acetyltransferase n=1 Tax=Streptomyces sp. NPDC057910 TaxID=3346278 RepID=UPI0036E1139B
MTALHMREGGPNDAPATLDLLDRATQWLVTNGRTGQWGSDPWSSQPASVRRIRRYTQDMTVRIAELDDTVVGVSVLSDQPQPYVAAATEQEMYIRLLVTDRALAGKAIGQALVSDARTQALRRGIGLLRTDCYNGDGALVHHYRKLGFRPTRSILVPTPGTEEPWPCQLLEMRI